MRLFSGKSDDSIVIQLTAHQSDILAYLHTIMPGDPSVNDVLQRTNLVIWKKRHLFKVETNFRAWAFSIARWEVKSHHKELKQKSWLIIDDELTQRISSRMDESTEDHSSVDLRLALEMCLKNLKPNEQELISHRYQSSAPLKEFANSSGHTIGTLKVNLHRIRTTLRRCIESRKSINNALQS